MTDPTPTSKQRPLGTGFTAASTAEDVLAGRDLTGTNVIITAGHAGLGREVARTLVAAGASVTVGARHPERATAGLAEVGLDGIEVGQLDLMDPVSIDAFAERWLESARPLHVLVNGAGLPAPEHVVRDARGYEAQFSTNHLGHFQLTTRLHPALRAAHGARVVNVSSGAQRASDIRWDDPHFTRDEYDRGLAYAQSKTANVLFAVELDRRWAAEGIRGYAVHPGIVAGTTLNGAVGPEALRAMGLIDENGEAIIDPERGKKTVEQGASTIVFAVTSPLLAGIGGVYLLDNDVSPMEPEPFDPATFAPGGSGEVTGEVAPHSIDPASAVRLWDLSERLLVSH